MEGYIGEVRLFAATFAPVFWQDCDGRLLSIAEYTALFAIIGTQYGGDGQTTFAVPDLRGRVAIGAGSQPGGATYIIGQIGGAQSVALTSNNLPNHQHTVTGSISLPAFAGAGNMNLPGTTSYPANGTNAYHAIGDGTQMGTGTTAPQVAFTGSSLPMDIKQPYIGLRYIICLEGIFPSRN